MQMTDGEILSSFRQAKDKAAQVKILSELNACPIQTIKDILIANGVDHRQLPRAKRKGTEVTTKNEQFEIEKALSKSESPNELEEQMLIGVRTGGIAVKPPTRSEAFAPIEKAMCGALEKEYEREAKENNRRNIIKKALQCYRKQLEDEMAIEEAAFREQMAWYTEQLKRVEDVLEEENEAEKH